MSKVRFSCYNYTSASPTSHHYNLSGIHERINIAYCSTECCKTTVRGLHSTLALIKSLGPQQNTPELASATAQYVKTQRICRERCGHGHHQDDSLDCWKHLLYRFRRALRTDSDLSTYANRLAAQAVASVHSECIDEAGRNRDRQTGDTHYHPTLQLPDARSSPRCAGHIRPPPARRRGAIHPTGLGISTGVSEIFGLADHHHPALHFPLPMYLHRGTSHHRAKLSQGTESLSLRSYAIPSSHTLSDMPPSQACTVKALSDLQDLH